MTAPRTGPRLADADVYTARRWRDRGGQPASGRQAAVALALGSAGKGSAEWLRAAALAGDTEAMIRLGLHLVDREGPSPEATRWLRQAAESGDPQGQLHYGRLLVFSDRVQEAERWLDAALAAAPPLAATLVSDLRMRGADDLADVWEQKAAEAGDAEAAVNLAGRAYRRGDQAAARRWAEWARDLGSPGMLQAMESIVPVDRGRGRGRRWRRGR